MKYIENWKYICVLIIEKKIQIYLIKYNYGINNYYLNLIKEDNSTQYINIGLYDTTIAKSIKILCSQENNFNQKISCCFLNIMDYNNPFNLDNMRIERLGDKNLTFISNLNDFSEKDCCFSEFNDEYLFCCGILNFIIV